MSVISAGSSLRAGGAPMGFCTKKRPDRPKWCKIPRLIETGAARHQRRQDRKVHQPNAFHEGARSPIETSQAKTGGDLQHPAGDGAKHETPWNAPMRSAHQVAARISRAPLSRAALPVPIHAPRAATYNPAVGSMLNVL